ncbi:MAG: mevalonate kinase [Microbacteriaceae bacterium]|nr:mevalonate kinase [Microbacteriaceae bacterium]
MTSTLPIRLPQTEETAGGARERSADSPRSTGEGSAHAKAILFGEHAVVYGAPAIAIPIHELEAEARVESAERGIRIESELYSGEASAAPQGMQPVVTAIEASLAQIGAPQAGVRVQILSAIPHSRGLGSSAAVAAAVARAIADWAGRTLGEGNLFEVVQQAERVAHGNPSGLDARAVTADSTIRFDFGVVRAVRTGQALSFVLADSGIAGSTAEAVGAVRSRRESDTDVTEGLLSRLARIAEDSIEDIARGDRDAIGARMSEAHDLLDQIGVSSPTLNSLVDAAIAAGAYGAKLTGGGLGGCIIALAESPQHAEELGSALRRAGALRTWTATVPAA